MNPNNRHDSCIAPRVLASAARPIPADLPGRNLVELLRERLDPVGVDHQAKADQNALVARFGGREQALDTGAPGATPVPKS